MTRKIEAIAAAAGVAIGYAIAGPQGALFGVVGGASLGAIGVNSLRARTDVPTIYIDGKTRAEMESMMHLAISASWALRPLIETEIGLQKRIVQEIFDALVESYTVEVTPYVQEMQMHLMRVVQSGIMPEDSIAHVRRRYAPRFMRKEDEVSYQLAKHILQIMEFHGVFTEGRDWFIRWCQEIGLGKKADAIWAHHFSGGAMGEIPSHEEWKAERHREAIASYYEDDEAA